MKPLIRQETPADILAIHALTKAAFLNAPHTAHTEHFIVDALRAAKALTASLVADDNGTVVGHVAISPVSIPDNTQGWYGLGPVSVSPALQRQGIGSRLMAGVLQQMKSMGAAGCVLVGDPAFYARFGFVPATSLILPGIPPQYFLAIAFTQPLPQGIVTFHEAFTAQG